MDKSTINLLKEELEVKTISSDQWKSGNNLIELLTEELGLFSSKSDARRAIQGNALQINRKKITDTNTNTSDDQIFSEKYVFIENGKKQKVLIELE